MEVLMEHVYGKVEKWGPADPKITEEVFKKIGFDKKQNLVIVDVGSGRGESVKALLKAFPKNIKKIICTEINKKALQSLSELSEKNEKICYQKFSMIDDTSKLGEKEVDLVWGEGSFYCCGFTKVAKNFSKLLKKNGFLCASQLVYLENDLNKIPKEIKDFWQSDYPEIQTIADFRKGLKEELSEDYEIMEEVVFTKKAWDNYYNPIEKIIGGLDEKLKQNKGVQQSLKEINIYKKQKKENKFYFSYVFFILKKK